MVQKKWPNAFAPNRRYEPAFVSVQFYGRPEIATKVSKNCFWPVPKVDSAVLKITPVKREKIDEEKFFRIVRAGFAHPANTSQKSGRRLNLPVENNR